MQYIGKFRFDNKEHAVTCLIDEKNNIYTKVHETDINGYKRKISGWAENKYITIYESRLVDHGIGYYKYQSRYMAIYDAHLKYGRNDFINNIQDFRFTFRPLKDWLGLNTIRVEEYNIKLEIPDDIILFQDKELSIKIKYFKQGIIPGTETTKVKEVQIIPCIVVNSLKKISVNEIMHYIQLISRFFAILIGYTDNINEIYFHNYIDGKIKFDFLENILIINTDFSNKYDIKDGYSYCGFRTSYKNINEKISILFYNWFEMYNKHEYNIPSVEYFSPYIGHVLEKEFLVFTKVLEKFSICSDDKNRNKTNKKKISKILTNFYKKYEKELIDKFKKEEFRKEYIKNIDRIHNDVIESVIKKYDMRISLAQRIKKLDTDLRLEKYFNEKHVISLL